MNQRQPTIQDARAEPRADRREFLRASGGVGLSVAALATLSACETMGDLWPFGDDAPSQPAARPQQAQAPADGGDMRILNTALALEHEAIAAYQYALALRGVRRPLIPVFQLFQAHHREHRDGLIATIRAFNVQPVGERPATEYVQTWGASGFRNENDVLRLALRLERGAANAYIASAESYQDRRLARVAARVAADEVMHWTAVAGLLREQLPAGALSFGA